MAETTLATIDELLAGVIDEADDAVDDELVANRRVLGYVE